MAQRKPNDSKSKGANYKSKRSKSKKPFDKRDDSKSSRDNSSIKEEVSDTGTITKSGYSNDPAWWSRTGALAINATNISTYTPIGIPMDLMTSEDFVPTGIMRLDYVPCFGDIYSPTHPINVVARDLYDFINARNSRSSAYDPNDLMLYVIGVANAWVIHAWVRRVVGMYNTYSMLNRYWWDPVLASMGVEPITTTSTITDWVDLANYIAMTLNTLAVPNGIKYFERSQMLSETVYADSVSDKASLYYYSPAYLLKYGYDAEGKGQLVSKFTPWTDHSLTPTNRTLTPHKVKVFFDDLVSNLINDTEITLMKADIRKAFGEENCYRLGQLDRSFQHGYIYDGFVNLQTRNATVMDCLTGYNYSITQDMNTNSLTSPRVTTWATQHQEADKYASIAWLNNSHLGDHIFDFPIDIVTNDMWTEATKLHAYFSGSQRFRCTTEYILRDTMYVFNHGQLEAWPNSINIHVATTDISAENVSNMLMKMELASKFAASPLQWVMVTPDPIIHAPVSESYLIEDLTNYTNVGQSSLDKITDSSQLSIFTWHDLT